MHSFFSLCFLSQVHSSHIHSSTSFFFVLWCFYAFLHLFDTDASSWKFKLLYEGH
uniref:Uncharacterized protein n=1 Tax=Arundo donax TaxID=35708 RepID=A0A0A9BJZ5_ARUDO